MTTALDPEYGRLLQETQPRPVRNREENNRMLGQIEKLMLKGEENLSAAENDLLTILFAVVQKYENAQRAAHPRRKSTPGELLEYLMEEHRLSAKDLPLPASRVSEILKGKREVSKDQAKKLSEFFGVSPAVFIFTEASAGPTKTVRRPRRIARRIPVRTKRTL